MAAEGQINTYGSALDLGGGCYRLTEAQAFQSGSLWSAQPINLTNSFELQADIFLGCNDATGADGMVFAFRSANALTLGNVGEGIGYQNLAPTLGVELDTYENPPYGDPAFDHIGMISNGNMNHFGSSSLVPPVPILSDSDNAEDCQEHLLRISWDAGSQTLRAYVDCELRLSFTGNLVSTLFGGNPLVYWGFTASTGGETNLQRVCLHNRPAFEVLAEGSSGCGDSEGNASVSATGGSGSYDILWSNGSTANSQSGLAPGSYTVTVSDGLCSVESTVNILSPEAFDLLAGTDTSIVQGQAAPLSATLLGGTAPFDIAWSPPTGLADPNALDTDASPEETTTYTLSVTDANGCQANRSVTITVLAQGILAMPTGFSPNADGRNDLFAPFIPQGNVNVLSFKVFNRWGALLHDDAATGWDGTSGGQAQPVGTYVFITEYQSEATGTQILKGHFSLLR